jgi:transposase InsO family protein
MRTELVTDALDMAARNHPLAKGCIMHSDRGSQYQCHLVSAVSLLASVPAPSEILGFARRVEH